MIDAHSALLTYLQAPSDLKTLLGGDYVFWPEIPGQPGGPSMPRKAISFRFGGGRTEPMLYAQQVRAVFRNYGATHVEAMTVYRALYDRLHMTQNFIVGDVGFHGASESGPGEPLEDPSTGWPFVFVVYDLLLATIPVEGGAGGS